MRLTCPIEEEGRKPTRVFLWKYDSISISITARAFLNISSFTILEFWSPIWEFWLLLKLERNLTEQYSRAFPDFQN